MAKPKKVTTYRTCPECGDRGTKLLHLKTLPMPGVRPPIRRTASISPTSASDPPV